ncbi:MAG: hypothetical protein GY827_11805 [Cytophagales bacterium]|nr:hypothetical protein [Cytophagales bacterium]
MRAKKEITVVCIVLVFIILSGSKEFYAKDNIMSTPITLDNMPIRNGKRPLTTNTNPHMQLNQQPEDISYIKSLEEWAFKLSNINKKPSLVSVPGAVAMFMDKEHTCKSCNAFMADTEFAHFHPHPDYSLHLGLPEKDAQIIIDKGWGEWHPLIKRGFLPPNMIMMYAPRNQEEFEVSKFILGHSYKFASGKVK